MKQKKFMFVLPEALDKDLEELARIKCVSKASVARMAIATFILAEDAKNEILKSHKEENKRD